jgi:hypothetical protein
MEPEAVPGALIAPVAKHRNPDYCQVTVYIKRRVKTAVKARTFTEGRELSALIEQLLESWLVHAPDGRNRSRNIAAKERGT